MDSNLTELANELRDKSDEFTGENSPEEVIQVVLQAQIDEFEEQRGQVAEEQARLKKELTGTTELEQSESGDETGDEISNKQAELKQDITGGQ